MLRVNNIKKHFQQQAAVDGLSFEVQPGEFFGLLGPNGAGKSTTIHMISGIMPPDDGSIYIGSDNLYDNTSSLKHQMGVVPQEIALYDNLSALQNLIFWGGLYVHDAQRLKARAEALLEWVGLSDRKKDLVQHYSGGMKRRVNIAAALMHDPQLILMDEPTVGIDPQSRNKIYEMLTELHRQGKTIIYTTHYMNEAEQMCDRIGIMDHGKLLAIGSLDSLRNAHAGDTSIAIRLQQSILPDNLPKNMSLHYDTDLLELTLTSENPHKDLGDIIHHLHLLEVAIDSIQFHRADLETIFLNLTGRTLRD
jgi:ABC-2 type transport system ATP-binding protein